jgi:hypothetical protein
MLLKLDVLMALGAADGATLTTGDILRYMSGGPSVIKHTDLGWALASLESEKLIEHANWPRRWEITEAGRLRLDVTGSIAGEIGR